MSRARPDTKTTSPLRSGSSTGAGDRVFRGLSRGAGIALLGIMAAIAAFLLIRGLSAIQGDSANFLTEQRWAPKDDPPTFGIAAIAFGTVLSSLIAMALAVPVAVGVALFISHYAPRRIAIPLGYVIDLLAAVPSVVYGLWGIRFLVPRLEPLHQWLGAHLGFIPLFEKSAAGSRTMLTAGVVLAIMILPIIAAVSREVFLQVPRDHEEAALALGATRWEMIRAAVLPFGRPGVISAAMLGLGRALGETVAVAMVLSPRNVISLHILNPEGNTIAANIANSFGEADDFARDALIASGLVLFVITLIVNASARLIVARRREFAGAAI
ncbi:MAG: phosphate ABC transporter permease subunit PstC [Streptosporangiales bacterium]|nr:phosphate ABC transporter permease subunit PstC [Streptosporangiales bacterium]